MENSYWDAVAFVPKRNIKFHGFGLLSNYEKMDMKLKVKWQIEGDDPSEEIYIELPDAEKDSDHKWHEIYLKDLGSKSINVSEGQKIHCMVRITTEYNDSNYYEHRRSYYGYNGYRDRYSTLPDQDYDFDTKRSEHN